MSEVDETSTIAAEAAQPSVMAAPLFSFQLVEVVLGNLNIQRKLLFIDPEDNGSAHLEFRVEFMNPSDTENDVAYRLSLHFSFAIEEEQAYTIDTDLVGIFAALNDTSSPNEAAADVIPSARPPLSEANVVSLLWPYMRELVHQLQLRMRVPLALLPTFDMLRFQQMDASTNEG